MLLNCEVTIVGRKVVTQRLVAQSTEQLTIRIVPIGKHLFDVNDHPEKTPELRHHSFSFQHTWQQFHPTVTSEGLSIGKPEYLSFQEDLLSFYELSDTTLIVQVCRSYGAAVSKAITGSNYRGIALYRVSQPIVEATVESMYVLSFVLPLHMSLIDVDPLAIWFFDDDCGYPSTESDGNEMHYEDTLNAISK